MPNSLIFIDNRISNRTELLKQLPTDSRIIELNANQDGLQQIADAVSGYSNLDSIHLISHGSAGALYLGNSVLNSQTLPNYSTALNTIGNSLSSTGDMLLYGCNVAEGETGAAFIAQLAQATGADVAASTDITGQGGDWDLETQQGTIESQALELKGVETLSERDFTVLYQEGMGIVTTDFGSSARGNSLALQADGKILLGGSSGNSNGSYDFAVVRYNTDGSLDTSFNGDGKLTTNLGGNYDEGQSLSLQADGKILLGGYSDGNFALVRYNADGSLDTSFSGDGMLTTDFGGNDYGYSLSLQTDGKILLGGYSSGNFALVRYNTDGSLDASFNNSGIVTTDLGGVDVGKTLGLQADGKIVLGGYTYSNQDTSNLENYFNSHDFALVRYNANGTLDASFGDDGIVITEVDGYDVGQSLSIQADGKILLGGSGSNPFSQTQPDAPGSSLLVRYNADGSLDTSFSGDGKLAVDDISGSSLSLQTDGKILFGGNNNNNFALARYNTDGSLDTSFSGDGKLTTDLGDWDPYAAGLYSDTSRSLAFQSDGKILLGGYNIYYIAEYVDYALVRYNSDGSLDTSFGASYHYATGSLSITGTTTQNQTLSIANDIVDPYSINTLSYQWLADGQAISGATGNTFTLTQAQVGKTISLQMDYTNEIGLSSSLLTAATQAIANANDNPTGSVTITGITTENQTLTASNTLADIDDLGTITYQWLANGVAISGATGETLALTQAQVGKTISVQASYTDGFSTLEHITSAATLPIANVNDAVTGDVTISGTATQNQTLTAISTLADVDGLGTLAYQWLADGVAINGATSSTFTLGQAQVGKAISVKASYTDGQNTAESVTSAATLAVTNVNDVPTGSLTISGTTTQNQTLTAISTLADVDGLGTLAYQWLADGVAIEGETTTSLALMQALVGKAISVQASYTDGFGMTESVTSAATRTVVNVNDAPNGSVTISGIAAQNETLTASNTLADDADGMGVISYQWLANGRVISGATGETLTLTQAQVGKAISVQASYTDGQNTLERITSTATQAITNVNDAPTGSVAISGTATQGRTLTATNTLADADGMGALAYQWLADGVVINGATARTLQLTQNQVNKAISVQIRYTDLQGTVETISSTATTAVQNINDAPTGQLTISGLIQEDALIGHELSAISTLADTDGLGEFSYQWLANGAIIRGATNSTFTPTILQQGKQITVKVQYTDAFGTREIIQSAAVSSTADMQYGDSVRVGSNDRLQGGIFASDLYGYSGNDELRGGAGDDRLYGGYGDDFLYGEADNDELEGDQGNDKIYGDAGNDTLTGGTGKDSLYGGDGNDVLDGSSDIDFMDGGNGADTYYVDNKGDIVRDSGTDSAKDVLYITAYLQGGYVLGAGIDNAVLSALANNAALTGNAGNNTLTGNTSANNLKGGVGIDTLKGGAGNDTLIGGAGKDVLNGGTGKDIFKLEKLIESGVTAAERDVVQGFVRGQDKLGLSALDANTAVAGDQSFDTIISKSATFTQAGQLQLKEGILYGNTDADVGAEFSIALTGITTLTLADIIA